MSNNLDLINENIIDSFGLISLIIAIEKNFKIKIKRLNVNIKDFKSINSIVKFLKKNYAKKLNS